MDAIVFNQQELDSVSENIKSVALCDNSFVLPLISNREYIAIGSVSATVSCPAIDAIRMGLVFTGFIPEFDKSVPVTMKRQQIKAAPSSFSSSFTSSFAGSFMSSFTTSFTTSFSSMHEYEYEYGTSFSGSFTGSFRTSFKKTVIREIAVNGYGLNLI